MDTNEVKLSWYDKNVLPRTKEYKDFVNELKNTPIERFYRDGERQFSEKEQKYLAIFRESQKVDLTKQKTEEDLVVTKVKFHHEDTDFIRKIHGIVNEDKQISYLNANKLNDNTYEIDLIHNKGLNAREIVDDFIKQNSLKETNEELKNYNNENKNQEEIEVGELFSNLPQEGKDLVNKYMVAESQELMRHFGESYNQKKIDEYREMYKSATPEIQKSVDDIIKLESQPVLLERAINKYQQTKNQNNMAQGEFNQQEYLENQVKYLGFGESQEIKDQIKKGIEGTEKEFHIHTTSDKVMNGNKADFTLNFKKGDKGEVFLNSYDATLTTKKGEERTHSFPVNRSNNITAKEAINLLEGRAVKTELTNKETGEISPAFIKLKLKEDKNQYGNYQMEYYNKNYGVDTAQIMDKSNLKLNDDIQRERTQKSLEKGNITKVTFKDGNNGFAILNPQYKMLNLYDEKMNRINTNKEAPKVEIQDNQKNNVREQSQRRSL
ncbi:hypothetical protein [Ornithobacterium rhinotracheale]|uniref:hypothetical protein n=1 Tax=Ornithobacterium rhinotracheale TaxID=28251 RepID=UPI004035FA64